MAAISYTGGKNFQMGLPAPIDFAMVCMVWIHLVDLILVLA